MKKTTRMHKLMKLGRSRSKAQTSVEVLVMLALVSICALLFVFVTFDIEPPVLIDDTALFSGAGISIRFVNVTATGSVLVLESNYAENCNITQIYVEDGPLLNESTLLGAYEQKRMQVSAANSTSLPAIVSYEGFLIESGSNVSFTSDPYEFS